MKKCSICKNQYSLSDFCKRTNSKDGHGIICSKCRKKTNEINKNNRQKWWKQYYAKNKKIICAKKILYRLSNAEKIQDIKSKSYQKNKEAIKLQNKKKKTLIKEENKLKNHSISLSEYYNV